jgi:alanine or glycine:cation symporter, AGCS family
MTMLAFVNLIALAMLFKICMRVLKDYDDQRRAGSRHPCSIPVNSRTWIWT